MNVMITGGTGLIGSAITRSLCADGHKVLVLTRDPQNKMVDHPEGATPVGWDGRTTQGWGELVNEMDAIVNLAGKSTATYPWNNSHKRSFWNSRVWAGEAVTDAIRVARKKPRVLIQSSGIGYYGNHGDVAEESTPPADDFMARLTVAWEASSQSIEELGVRRVVIRTAVVLTPDNIIMKLMELPVRLYFGGHLGSGLQILPWIHMADEVGAIRFLIENDQARGAYNLIASESTSNDIFIRTLAKMLNRPYWFHVPAFLLRLLLGEMSVMVLEGRSAYPRRLLEAGYEFKFPVLETALKNLYHKN